MLKKPRISVIIPYYEGARWLPVSAASVLGQAGAELELIVADDGSQDPAGGIAAALRDDRMRVIRIGHSGKGAAINAGVKNSAGDIICVLDQDDRMLPGRLAKQLAALDADPAAAAVYSDYERVEESGKPIDVFRSRQALPGELLHAMASGTGLISMQTMAIRRAAVEAIGGFSEDPALTGLDDGEFFARLICSGLKLLYVPCLAGQWVRHAENYSQTPGFHAARLVFLKRLKALAEKHSMLEPEMKYFISHGRVMRGIYSLEHGDPRGAVTEFTEAVRVRPFDLNSRYLLVKALALSLIGRGNT